MQSEAIDQIAPALAEALPRIPHAPMDSANPHFGSRFASLKAILNVARPILAEHGLFITQSVTPESVISRVVHTSGQWIGSECKILMDKPSCQGQGSGITYARRYSLAPLLGIYSEEDDDGNAAETPSQTHQDAPQSPQTENGGGGTGATQRQRNAIWAISCEVWPGQDTPTLRDRIEAVCSELGIPPRSDDMTREQASQLIDELDKRKPPTWMGGGAK